MVRIYRFITLVFIQDCVTTAAATDTDSRPRTLHRDMIDVCNKYHLTTS